MDVGVKLIRTRQAYSVILQRVRATIIPVEKAMSVTQHECVYL